MREPHPSTIVQYELDERGLSVKDFAREMKIDLDWARRFFDSEEPMTIAVAKKIEDAWAISATSLMNLQKAYENDKEIVKGIKLDNSNGYNL